LWRVHAPVRLWAHTMIQIETVGQFTGYVYTDSKGRKHTATDKMDAHFVKAAHESGRCYFGSDCK
jgi:hypothetical protein